MPVSRTFCVVPGDTDAAVIAALQQQYADDPSVTVVVDKRGGMRSTVTSDTVTRRPVARYRLTGEVAGAEIPGVRFEQHLPAVGVSLADLPIEQVVALAAKRDSEAAAELRWRCYQFVVTQLTRRVRDRDRANLAFPEVMDAVQDALDQFRPGTDFWAWLLALVSVTPLDDA